MRSVSLWLKTAVPLCVALLGCVEQDNEKPTAEDLAVAKQNILTTAPTPKYAVNADLDGKVVYLGLDADHVPIEPGKDVTLTHYWKLVSPPGQDWKMFTHLNGGGSKSFINADHAPVKGKYPIGAWKAGEIIRDRAHDPPAGRLGGALGGGLRRVVARSDAHDRQERPARRGGARARRDDPGEREAGRRRAAQALRRAHGDQGAEDRRQARRAGVGVGADDGRLRQHHDRDVGAAEDRSQDPLGQEVPLRRYRERGFGRVGQARQARRQAVDRRGGRNR